MTCGLFAAAAAAPSPSPPRAPAGHASSIMNHDLSKPASPIPESLMRADNSRTYNRVVSFDTFDNRDAPDYSLSLHYKHKNYLANRRTRTFLCAVDENSHSDFALEWLMEELVENGDELVCLRVVEKDSQEGHRYRAEAQKLFNTVVQKNTNDEKAISLVMELAVGRVQDVIQRMVSSVWVRVSVSSRHRFHASETNLVKIQIYEPSVLIVGTRGRSTMQGLLPGSISKYCLQQSPVPVIVVRPSAKREYTKNKRRASSRLQSDSASYTRRIGDVRSGRLFDRGSTDSLSTGTPEEEATAVAKAVRATPDPLEKLPEEREAGPSASASVESMDRGSSSSSGSGSDSNTILSKSTNPSSLESSRSSIIRDSRPGKNQSIPHENQAAAAAPKEAHLTDSSAATPAFALQANTGAAMKPIVNNQAQDSLQPVGEVSQYGARPDEVPDARGTPTTQHVSAPGQPMSILASQPALAPTGQPMPTMTVQTVPPQTGQAVPAPTDHTMPFQTDQTVPIEATHAAPALNGQSEIPNNFSQS